MESLFLKLKLKMGFELNGSFTSKELDVDNTSTFQLKNIKGKSNQQSIKNMKIGDIVSLKTKGLFVKDADLDFHLKLKDEIKT